MNEILFGVLIAGWVAIAFPAIEFACWTLGFGRVATVLSVAASVITVAAIAYIELELRAVPAFIASVVGVEVGLFAARRVDAAFFAKLYP